MTGKATTDESHTRPLNPRFRSELRNHVSTISVLPWRSNRQPTSTLSPTESEIYALSTGVKGSRLYHWVLEEFNRVETIYPFVVKTDSTGARSFQRDTCPSTKLRGRFDFMEMWVEELRERGDISTELVSDSDNLADILTKCLSNVEFVVKREK
jgi:hypothetical protein